MTDKVNNNGFISPSKKKIFYIGDVVAFIKILKTINFKIYGVAAVSVLLALIEVVALFTLATFVNSVLQQPTSSAVSYPLISWLDFSNFGFIEHAFFCFFMFALRFCSGLLLQNYILLQSSNMQTALRSMLFRLSLDQRANGSIHKSKASGAISDLIVRQVNLAGKALVEPSLRVLGELVILMGILAVVLFMSPILLLLLTVISTPIFLLYIFKFKTLSRNYGNLANKSLESIGELATALSGGWRQLTVPSLQSSAIGMLEKSSQQYAVNDRRANLIAAAPRYFLELFLAIYLIFALLIVNASSTIDFTEMVFVAGAGLRSLPIVTSISNALISFQFNRAVLQNIVDVISGASHQIPDNLSLQMEECADETTPTKKLTLQLQKVSFAYNSKNELISNVNLSLETGDFLLISGKSGVGKTTLMDIICGARSPSSGTVIYNGCETNKINPVTTKIFYVPQEPLIIPGTILGNVLMSDGAEASDKETRSVTDALLHVGLGDLVENLPETVNANVGPDGDKLSGGQKQRLVLARALYHGAEIFAFDETISGLEPESKLRILKLMKALAESGKIVILISHDMIAEKFATKIFEL